MKDPLTSYWYERGFQDGKKDKMLVVAGIAIILGMLLGWVIAIAGYSI